MDATPEEWRPVVGHEGAYEVSSFGRVRSLDRIITFTDGRSRLAKGRILKPWALKRIGHLCVSLSQGQKSLVHVLVLEAFVGPRPDGLVCCHNDGNPTNNHADNLRWDTCSENNHDLVRHGTHWQVLKTHCPQGHEYNAENTRIYNNPNGWVARQCRVCARDLSRSRKAQIRAQRPPDWQPRKKGLRTHCNRGHEYTPENTYAVPKGGRQCKQCRDIYTARQAQRSQSCESEMST